MYSFASVFFQTIRCRSQFPHSSSDKIFGGQKFSADKNFRHQLEISAVLSAEKNQMMFLFHFGGQIFSGDKIFGSKPDFRHFCPPKFCPIRYMIFHLKDFQTWKIQYPYKASSCRSQLVNIGLAILSICLSLHMVLSPRNMSIEYPPFYLFDMD